MTFALRPVSLSVSRVIYTLHTLLVEEVAYLD
jgi:hypothetical protein